MDISDQLNEDERRLVEYTENVMAQEFEGQDMKNGLEAMMC